MKLLTIIAAGLLTLSMNSVFAAEPVALTDTQMDNITAGAALAGGIASAGGSVFARSFSRQNASSVTTLFGTRSSANNASGAVALGAGANASAGGFAVAL